MFTEQTGGSCCRHLPPTNITSRNRNAGIRGFNSNDREGLNFVFKKKCKNAFYFIPFASFTDEAQTALFKDQVRTAL
jgi:hypothetical protein